MSDETEETAPEPGAVEADAEGLGDALDAAAPARRSKPEDSEEIEPPDEAALGQLERNDIGNAERLRERFGRDLLYVIGRNWLAWDGRLFNDLHGKRIAMKRAMDTAKAIKGESKAIAKMVDSDLAVFLESPGAKKLTQDQRDDVAKAIRERPAKLAGWSTASGMHGKLSAMLACAEPDLNCEDQLLDNEPWLLTVGNGTLELDQCDADGRAPLREFRRSDLMTIGTTLEYDDKATCPELDTFLEQAQPDEEMRAFLWRCAGLSATGDMSNEVIFLNYGRGRNGKGTFLQTFLAVLEDVVTNIQFATIKQNDFAAGADASPDLADLVGKRAAVVLESPVNARMSDEMVKSMSGRDPIKVRRLHEPPFPMYPKFKLWVSFNDRPDLAAVDAGMWARMLTIPWEVSFADNPDLGLKDRLLKTSEKQGFLRRLLQGLHDYRINGLNPPAKVFAATAAYREEVDTVGNFLKDWCEHEDPQAFEPVGDLRAAYELWARQNGMKPEGETKFWRALTNHGKRSGHENGKRVRYGVSLSAIARQAVEDAGPGADPGAAPPGDFM